MPTITIVVQQDNSPHCHVTLKSNADGGQLSWFLVNNALQAFVDESDNKFYEELDKALHHKKEPPLDEIEKAQARLTIGRFDNLNFNFQFIDPKTAPHAKPGK